MSSAAVLTSAVLFTADLVFEPRPLPPKRILLRQAAEQRLPQQYEALLHFLPERQRTAR